MKPEYLRIRQLEAGLLEELEQRLHLPVKIFRSICPSGKNYDQPPLWYVRHPEFGDGPGYKTIEEAFAAAKTWGRDIRMSDEAKAAIEELHG